MFYANHRSQQQPVSAVTISLTRLTLFACCVTILIANVGSAQSLAPEEVATLNEMVDAVVDGVAPGVAIGIVRDGEVVYERYVGYAELDHEVPIDAKTRFNIASNAKQFTALCVLRLVDEGKLSLDDDIRKYFPELYPDHPMPITIGNLITHTSGIRDVYDLYGLTGNVWWKQFIGNREALDLLQRQTELNFEPGSDYLYSNSNYLLLTEVIAQVTGEAFGTYTTEMFQALGMSDTEFLTNAMTVMPHRARPYGDWGGWKQYASIASVHGDGNLFTTLRDQLTWEQTVQRGHCDLFDAELMAAGQGPLPGQDIETYGFGIELGSYHGFQDRSHAGSTGAYNAYFIRLPTEQLAVVVMSNSSRVASHRLALKTVDLLLEIEETTESFPVGPAEPGNQSELAELVGDYRTSDGTLIKIVAKQGELFREIYRQAPSRLIHETGNLYRYESNPALKMAFSETKGKRRFTIFNAEYAPIEAVRLPAAELEQDYAQTLNGRYVNAETGAEFTLTHRDGGEYELEMNDQRRDATLMRRDLIFAGGRELRVTRDNGVVTGMLMDRARLRDIRFERIPSGQES